MVDLDGCLGSKKKRSEGQKQSLAAAQRKQMALPGYGLVLEAGA
jgi:hypothetical protein